MHLFKSVAVALLVLTSSLKLAAQGESKDSSRFVQPAVLDQTVTTSTIVPTRQRELSVSVTVITGDQLKQAHVEQLNEIFRGWIPGIIAWDLGSNDYQTALFVRGKSSLDTDFLKAYVDGVEVASPVYLATIDPNSVERIEVIRGPQASTIYGLGSNAGVIQIFTKKGIAAPERPQIDATISAGAIESPYMSGHALQQAHALTVQSGVPTFSYTFGGSYLHSGEWFKDYKSDDLSGFGGFRTVWNRGSLSLSGRYADRTFVPLYNPEMSIGLPPISQDADGAVRQYTLGGFASVDATSYWQHRVVAGHDQTSLRANSQEMGPYNLGTTYSSFEHSTRQRTSVAYNTSAAAPIGKIIHGTITVGVDHSSLTTNRYAEAGTSTGGVYTRSGLALEKDDHHTTGFFSQLQLGLRDVFFVTAALRGDRTDALLTSSKTLWSPHMGAAYVQTLPLVTLKIRGAYGESTRIPLDGYIQTNVSPSSIDVPILPIEIERQKGFEGGIDILAGNQGSVGITYFNQKTSELYQMTSGFYPGFYEYSSTARVKNIGWEISGGATFQKLQLNGQISFVTSTIDELAPTYTGNLRIGDAMIGVPKRSAGVFASYAIGSRSHVGAGLTHIGSWRDIDYLVFYACLRGTGPCPSYYPDGYLTEYPSVTKINLNASHRFTPKLDAFLKIDNVGNSHKFEQDNLALIPGRTSVLGLRILL